MRVSRFNKKKLEKLSVLVKQIANSKRVKNRDLAKVRGTSEAALPSIKYGRLHLFFLQKLKNCTLRECLGNFLHFPSNKNIMSSLLSNKILKQQN